MLSNYEERNLNTLRCLAELFFAPKMVTLWRGNGRGRVVVMFRWKARRFLMMGDDDDDDVGDDDDDGDMGDDDG